MGVSSDGLSPGSSPRRPWAHHFCFGAIFIPLVYKTGGCTRSVVPKCGPWSGPVREYQYCLQGSASTLEPWNQQLWGGASPLGDSPARSPEPLGWMTPEGPPALTCSKSKLLKVPPGKVPQTQSLWSQGASIQRMQDHPLSEEIAGENSKVRLHKSPMGVPRGCATGRRSAR